jgi:hypothetical protein
LAHDPGTGTLENEWSAVVSLGTALGFVSHVISFQTIIGSKGRAVTPVESIHGQSDLPRGFSNRKPAIADGWA